MDDVSEAKDLIAQIREEMGVDQNGGIKRIASILEKALDMLSKQLYSKPTHFIFELVQNADDCNYETGVVPQLEIIYQTDGFVWVGCNELGFTRGNVEAICRVNDSTKKIDVSEDDPQKAKKGYIGEKGIGFKSVFTVADVVWIKSGALQFKFDKNKRLGMIAPEWCELPTSPLADHRTKFCFQVSKEPHRRIVRNGLRDLKPEVLLFLRKLRSIDIRVQKPSGACEESRRLSRADEQRAAHQIVSISRAVSARSETDKYLVCRHTAEEMPAEERRPDVNETEVVIAFPVTCDVQPRIQSCLTFNFLPIRTYGLPFVLQGDFILSANREDIITENKWNESVIAAAQELFVISVRMFNEQALMRYTWPRYFKSFNAGTDTALGSFLHDVLARLRSEHVIYSYRRQLKAPNAIRHLPPIFTDQQNPPKPLLTVTDGMPFCAHPSYSFEDLACVGVQSLSAETFLTCLKRFIADRQNVFTSQPAAWHARMAEAVLDVGYQTVRDLRIVLLRNGEWTSGLDTFYFPEMDHGLTLPREISVKIIDEAAVSDPSRRKLFGQLGASRLTPTKVYHLILEHHKGHGKEYGGWTADIVIEHAWFLFTSTSEPRSTSDSELLLASENSGRLHAGSDLYMDFPGRAFQITKYFGTQSPYINRIHPGYAARAPADQMVSWLTWLEANLGVNTLPKLASFGKVTPEFKWLVLRKGENSWLHFLKGHWNQYARHFQRTSIKLDLQFSEAPVLCHDGQTLALQKVYLKTKNILAVPHADAHLDFVKVDNPDDAGWACLSNLGLHTSPDLFLYLKMLQMVQAKCPPTFKIEAAKKLYSGIQEHFSANLVAKAFDSKPLVYIPKAQSAGASQWVNLDVCRWSSPIPLDGVFLLKPLYLGLERFFVGCLKLTNVSADDLVSNLRRLSGQAEHSDKIKEMLSACGAFVGMKAGAVLLKIRQEALKVLPVKGSPSCLTWCADPKWFIADKTVLQECFEGFVPLLDIEDKRLAAVKLVLEAIGIKDRLLSNRVIEETQNVGESKFHQSFTDGIRSKALYLSRLVDPSRQKVVMQQLQDLQVQSSSALKLRRYVEVASKPPQRIYGKEETGYIVAKEENGAFVIQVSESAASKNRLPALAAARLAALMEVPKEKQLVVYQLLSTDDSEEIGYLLYSAGVDVGTAERSDGPKNEIEDNKPREPDDNDTAYATVPNAPSVTYDSTSKIKTLSHGHVTGTQTSAPSRKPIRASGKSNGSPHTTRLFTAGDLTAIRAAAKSRGASNLNVIATGNRTSTNKKQSTQVSRTGSNASSTARSFNMSEMRSALNPSSGSSAPLLLAAASQHQSRTPPPLTSFSSEVNEITDEVGGEGEGYVYDWLKSEFGIDAACWTSSLRARFGGLDEFTGNENLCADFTISDPVVCKRITEELNRGRESAVQHNAAVTYHIEVKATTGSFDEPFNMSNSQFDLAHKWHASESDVYVIFRVYNLPSDPDFRLFVDPHALMLAGELSFVAQGGYYVQPA